MGKVLSPGNLVDCECLSALARPILRTEIRANLNVTACMRCGEVSATVAIVEEPHPHDTHHVGNEVCALTDEAHAWLAKFPRCVSGSGRGRDRVFLGAGVRARSVAVLEKVEEAAREDQRRLDFAGRLRAAGIPNSPAPVLPDWFDDLSGLPAALSLTPDAGLQTIAVHMSAFGDRSIVAVDVFERRPNYEIELAALLDDADRRMQLAAHEFICHRRFLNSEVVEKLKQQLLSPAPRVGLNVLLSTLYLLGTLAKPFVPALRRKAESMPSGPDQQQVLRIAELVSAA